MLMRISSRKGRTEPLDRPSAWACLVTNLTVLPGLGSWIAGQTGGLFQMGLASTGFILTSVWAWWFVKTWIRLKQWPTEIGPHFGKALLGLAFFAAAWIWALASSLALLRAAPKSPPP
jgi:hypothetical protein